MKFKHMLTAECPLACPECITRNVKIEQDADVVRVGDAYLRMQDDGFTDIMITGGEPLAARNWREICWMASNKMGGLFNAHITTSQFRLLGMASLAWLDGMPKYAANMFVDVTISLHGRLAVPVPVHVDVPVYAAIMLHEYNPRLPAKLAALGYSGLSINEDQRGEPGGECGIIVTPRVPPNFTFKVNRAGACMDRPIMLPDLTVVESFRSFL